MYISNSSVNCLGTYCRTTLKTKTRAEIFSHALSSWVTFLCLVQDLPPAPPNRPHPLYPCLFVLPLLLTFMRAASDTLIASSSFWQQFLCVQAPRGMERTQAVSKLKESIFISEVRRAFIYFLLTPWRDNNSVAAFSKKRPLLRTMHSAKKDARSHPSLPSLQAGLFPESVFYLASSVGAPGYKKDVDIFGHEYNKQRGNERESTSLQQQLPPSQLLLSHQPRASPYVWLPPMQPTALGWRHQIHLDPSC